MNIREAKKDIINTVKAYLAKDTFGQYLVPRLRQRPILLMGPPGIGKSDTVRQLAAGLEEGTGKKVVVTDVRLLLFSPVDLRGVPVPDATRTFTDWLRPRVFDMDGSDGIVNLLFLDELSAAGAGDVGAALHPDGQFLAAQGDVFAR